MRKTPRVDTGIRVIVERLKHSAYKNIGTVYEPWSADGERHFPVVLIVAMEYGDNEEKLRGRGGVGRC